MVRTWTFDLPAIKFQHGNKTTKAGSAVPLAKDVDSREVLITAKRGNLGYVYLGGSAVSGSSYGERLSAGDQLKVAINNLNLIYIDVNTDNEGVDFLYTL